MSSPTPEHVMTVGFGFWASKAVLSAVELGLFTELARAPAELPTLQDKLSLHPRAARDFLDALVALKFLERDHGLYRNSPDADLFLDRAKPSYIGGLLEMANARLYQAWGGLTKSLQTGQPNNEAAAGEDIFAALYADPVRLRGFLAAMSGVSIGSAHAIAAKFPWAHYRSFADLGCAQGMVPATIARAHPQLHGIGFDLPPVQPIFEQFIAQNGVEGRVSFQPGNFFEDPLPKADVMIMGHILHDWDLAQKKRLLARVHEALPKGGALIVYEAIIDDDRNTNAHGLLMSLNMLIETPGGFDYTGADCQAWMREAGFASTRVEHLAGPESMVIGFK